MNNKGVIAAGHDKTAEAAQIILDEGGNAFDAAIAAGFAACVSEFGLTSLGGGGFLLAHTCDNKNTLFDFFTQTPCSRKLFGNPDFFPVSVDFGGATQEFHVGMASIAVPGVAAGYLHVHKKLGKLPFEVVVRPAIEMARKGIELNKFQHFVLTLLKPIIIREESGRDIFTKNRELIKVGSTYRMPELANSIEYLAREGLRGFYEGEIASELVKDSKDRGGYLTMDDFKNYQVVERNPLAINYHGNKFITNPPPSSGGALIAFALELLEGVNIGQYKYGSFKHLKTLSEIMRLTNLARGDGYDANIYKSDVINKFLASNHLKKYKEMLDGEINRWGSTTHLSIIDGEGNAVSMTTSNGEGSSYYVPGTGIMINNMLGEEDLNPCGFHVWPENVRMSSMMSPTMILKNGQPEIVLGSGGSNRIRTAILQVVSNIIDFKMSPLEAVQSSRIHWEKGSFNIEPGFSEEVIARLKKVDNKDEYKKFSEKSMFFGGVHTVTCNLKNKTFDGAGDKRRNGVVLKN